jgi:hypothetical protein
VITLSRWFEAEPRGDRLVAFGRKEARSAGNLRRDVTGQTARLTPARGGDVLLPGQEALLRDELHNQGRFQFSLRDAERPERSFASGRGRLEPRR